MRIVWSQRSRVLTVIFAMAMTMLVGTLIPTGAAGRTSQERPPNIILMLVDDLGWADVGCYGNNFNETPNIDRLAVQGMKFTDAYAAGPVCSPTRASILSGQYQARFSLTAHIPGHWRPFEKLVEPLNAPHMPLDIITLAESLGKAGYATAHFGKWHLGPPTHFPEQQGFDRSIVTSGRHFAPRFRTTPKVEVKPGTALTDFLTNQTIQFMEENRDQPFFIYLCHYAVHIPLEAKSGLIQKYEIKPPVPGRVNHPVYAAMVEDVDHSLGRIMQALDRLNLANETVLVFFSDNGGLRQRFDGQGQIVTSNAPLRNEKGTLYEGGIRVPLIIRWPGVVEPNTVNHTPVISVDFYPTFLETAGAALPDQPLDGESLLPLLTQTGQLRRQDIHFHYPHYHHSRPAGAIRQGRYKLIEFFDNGEVELYDLQSDLSETTNLAGRMPEKAHELRNRLKAWRQSVNAQMPKPNPKYAPDRAAEWWSRRTKERLK